MKTHRTFIRSGEKYEGAGALLNFDRLKVILNRVSGGEFYSLYQWANDKTYKASWLPSSVSKCLGAYDFDEEDRERPSRLFGLLMVEALVLRKIGDGGEEIELSVVWPFIEPKRIQDLYPGKARR